MLPRAAALLVAMFVAAPAVAQTAVTLACGSVGIEAQLCREGAEAWAKETGNRVTFVSTPSGATERLALFQQLLAARSADIDVFQIDVVWPGLLARHLRDLAGDIPEEERAAHLDAAIANNTVDGRLVALPWFTNAGVLYYRRDLLAKHGRTVPQDWDELAETARVVMEAERRDGAERLWGLVFQGRAYEGLTVNALEWVSARGGGTIIDHDGAVTVNNPRAADALAAAASWVGTIAPPGVLTYAEEEARGVFQSGDAVFMRNWPYAWPLVNGEDSPVRGRVGVAPLPRGAVLGGEQLAVSAYSQNGEAAVSLVRYLASVSEQKRRAIAAGLAPTIMSLYADAEVLAANPFLADFSATLAEAVARPSAQTGGRYNQVSAEFWNAVHEVLSGRADAEAALARLDRRLQRLSRGGRW
ncbi:ABC transporter substrate-binding protein [Elioraea rosea]|uniref:ABC transporter substrate-binding protein n=1 Tax=Elioraea rosea TaxID=2492390 RepID=UPI001181FE51|nr:ABC transporter substrate-binding protein [Elioraea rosea]